MELQRDKKGRFIRSGLSKEELKQNHNTSQKKWYEKNKDKIKKQHKEYCEKNRDKINKYQKQYYKGYYPKNKEDILKQQKEWKKENPTYHKEYQKEKYNSNSEFREKVSIRQKGRKIKIPKGQLCESCNKNLAKERHHEDYNKPLEVKFLCIKCHKKIPKEGLI